MEKQKFTAKPALGKGLASLLPGAGTSSISPPPPPAGLMQQEDEVANKDRHPGISMCATEEVYPSELQPRRVFDDQTIQELSDSIKANGLIQPLIVRKTTKGYELIAGERRWRAAKLAGLKQVPIVIRRTTDKEVLELALIENIQREDLNCIDVALAFHQLIHDFDLRQEDLSGRVGKDRTTVTNHLRLLKLPTPVQTSLKEKKISFGHGKALAGLEDARLIEKLANESAENKWSVRELENQIQKIKNLQEGRAAAQNPSEPIDPLKLRLRNLSRDLSNRYSTKVNLKGNDTRGKIVLEYFNRDDLDRLLSQLLGN